MKTEIAKVLEKNSHSLASEIALELGQTVKIIAPHLREMREQGIIKMDKKGVYSFTDSTKKALVEAKKPDSELRKKIEASMVAEAAPQDTEQAQAKAQDARAQAVAELDRVLSADPIKTHAPDAVLAIESAFKDLEAKLKAEPQSINRKALKLAVLERLALLLSDDIAEVLDSIAADIKPLPEQEAAQVWAL